MYVSAVKHARVSLMPANLLRPSVCRYVCLLASASNVSLSKTRHEDTLHHPSGHVISISTSSSSSRSRETQIPDKARDGYQRRVGSCPYEGWACRSRPRSVGLGAMASCAVLIYLHCIPSLSRCFQSL